MVVRGEEEVPEVSPLQCVRREARFHRSSTTDTETTTRSSHGGLPPGKRPFGIDHNLEEQKRCVVTGHNQAEVKPDDLGPLGHDATHTWRTERSLLCPMTCFIALFIAGFSLSLSFNTFSLSFTHTQRERERDRQTEREREREERERQRETESKR